MNQYTYPALQETVYRTTLENGLTVLVIPRPGFQKKLAYLATNFGAVHTKFTLGGEAYQVPAGIAHYLEHKLFDMPWGDVSAKFAALGANTNAFTSYDMTAYLFSCTEHFAENLALLVDFVFTPCFTPESVEKEQGIIGQEIGMVADTPDNRIFENLMQAMYEVHPIAVPILGTKETIGRITDKTLYDCHKAFYTPENMLLCVIGDVDPQAVADIAAKHAPAARQTAVKCKQWDEPVTCRKKQVEDRMEVAMPMFQLGFKCEPIGDGENAIRMEMIGDLAAEALFGESSPLYQRLYEQGLIDSSFGGGFETVDGMAVLTASGDSVDPQAVRQAILDQVAVLLETGMEEADFLRMKRSSMGRRIRDLDSFDSVLFRVCAYHFANFDYFDFPRVYQQITWSEVEAFLRRVVTPQRCCISLIYPVKEETK